MPVVGHHHHREDRQRNLSPGFVECAEKGGVVPRLLKDGKPCHGPIQDVENFTSGADALGAWHPRIVAVPPRLEKSPDPLFLPSFRRFKPRESEVPAIDDAECFRAGQRPADKLVVLPPAAGATPVDGNVSRRHSGTNEQQLGQFGQVHRNMPGSPRTGRRRARETNPNQITPRVCGGIKDLRFGGVPPESNSTAQFPARSTLAPAAD